MSIKPKERKSGWYVVEFSDGTQGVLPCENGIVDTIATVQPKIVNETEIFDQLKEAEQMRNKIEEAKEIIKGLNVIIHALTHDDCPMLERKDIEDVVGAAKQFIK